MLPGVSRQALKVPLTFFRYSVYIASISSTILCVLLPLSILTYWHFYTALVPQPTQLIALKGYTQDIDLSTTSSLKLDQNSDYRVNIMLTAVCSSASKGQVLQFSYTFSVQGASEPLYKDSFFIDCDTRYIHNAHNVFVPYNLRYWFSPWLVNHAKTTDIDLRGFLINGREAARTMKQMTLLIADGNGYYFMIDTHASQIAFSVVYSGFRYYLVRYFYLCFLLGLLVLWSISTLVCLITVAVLKVRNQEQGKAGDSLQRGWTCREEDEFANTREETAIQIKQEEMAIGIKKEDEDGWEDELPTKVEN